MGDIGRLGSEALGTITEDPTEQTPSRSSGTYCLPDNFGDTSESSKEGEATNTAAAEKEATAAAPSRSTNTFSVPDKNIESSDSSESGDGNTHPPAATPPREKSANAAEKIYTTTSAGNISPAIEETSVSPSKHSASSSSPHATIHKATNESNRIPDNDTNVARTKDSRDSWSLSRQLHESAREQLVVVLVHNPPARQERSSQVTKKKSEREGISSPSSELRDPPKVFLDESPVASTQGTQLQVASAAIRPEEIPDTLAQPSPPPLLRRSGRQRRPPQRYGSPPIQPHEVINGELEDGEHAKHKPKKSTPTSKNRTQRTDKRKHAGLEKAPTKRQKHATKGGTARQKKPAPQRRPPVVYVFFTDYLCER